MCILPNEAMFVLETLGIDRGGPGGPALPGGRTKVRDRSIEKSRKFAIARIRSIFGDGREGLASQR